jgi:DnaK suppressor protein
MPGTTSASKKVAPAKAAPETEHKSNADTASKSAAPRAGEGYKDEKFLASQRKALLEERGTYLEQAESLRAEADSLVEEMEPGDIQFDEESGEGGTVTVDRERDLALSAQALAAVEEIDHALAKIDLGTYGICENCGTLIPKNRLEALPFARLCIACKSGGLSRR